MRLIQFVVLLLSSSALAYRLGVHEGAINRGLTQRFGLQGHEAPFDFQWFTGQLVDHFDGVNVATWSQRYVVNDQYWKVGGPVFLVLGGEGSISAGYVGNHFITGEWAQSLGAMIVGLEHRFYGQSMPKNDTSRDSLRLLNAQQALADAASFRQYFAQLKNTGNSKWVVFGGSYSGSLSAWARMKFPHLFAGAFSTSGPVQAQEDFPEYMEVVSTSVGQACSDAIKSAMTQLNDMLDGEPEVVQQMFGLSPALVTEQDKQTFLEAISDPIAGIVQYNKDNNGRPALTIDQMCANLTSGEPLASFAAWTKGQWGPGSQDVTYQTSLQGLMQTGAARSWTFQTCIEYGYFQTGTSDKQPFPSRISLDYFRQICQDAYGAMPVSPNTQWINDNFGAKTLRYYATNTYFSAGTVDPWHRLAIVPEDGQPGIQMLGRGSAVVLISGTAHCADLYASSPNDLQGLTQARALAMTLLKQWIGVA